MAVDVILANGQHFRIPDAEGVIYPNQGQSNRGAGRRSWKYGRDGSHLRPGDKTPPVEVK